MKLLIPTSEFEWPRRTLSPTGMFDVLEDFDRITESFLRPTQASSVHFRPSCDVQESKDSYWVTFDMPGVKKEDIKIELQGTELIVSGERQPVGNHQADQTTIRHERMYGKFERTFALPRTVATEKIEAHYENGVLMLALPKAETAHPRTIQVQSDQGGLLSRLLGSKKDSNRELKDIKVS